MQRSTQGNVLCGTHVSCFQLVNFLSFALILITDAMKALKGIVQVYGLGDPTSLLILTQRLSL